MPRKWQEVSILIAGCGSIGKRHARILQDLGVCDIRACDPNVEACRKIAEEVSGIQLYDRYDDGLAEHPDTVLICTPPRMHVPMAVQAIQAGAHILCEKPISDSNQRLDELAGLARSERKKIMVALCFRYHEGILRAMSYLRDGRIGRLVSIRSLMGEHLPEVRPDYRDLFNSKSTGAFDLMHDLDLALWFANMPVKQVHCIYGNFSEIGIEAPDLVQFLIEFDGPCTASVHLDFFQRPRRRQFELIGSNGTIIVEFAQWETCTVSLFDVSKSAWQHEEIATDRDDMFRAEDKEFLKAVAENLPIRYSIDEARKSLEVILRGRCSGGRQNSSQSIPESAKTLQCKRRSKSVPPGGRSESVPL